MAERSAAVTGDGVLPGPILPAPASAGAEPFLFFRGARGQFTWWSWQRAGQCLAGAAVDPAESLAFAFVSELHEIVGEPETVGAAERLLTQLGASSSREIWISSAITLAGAGRIYAAAAVRAGWVVLREPAQPPPAATFLWARPTLLTGTGEEISTLLDAAQAEAPRWRPAPWLKRRLARLRTIVVDDDRVEGLEGRLQRLGASARVLPFRQGGW